MAICASPQVKIWSQERGDVPVAGAGKAVLAFVVIPCLARSADVIVTRDRAGFSNSQIPVVAPTEFMVKFP